MLLGWHSALCNVFNDARCQSLEVNYPLSYVHLYLPYGTYERWVHKITFGVYFQSNFL